MEKCRYLVFPESDGMMVECGDDADFVLDEVCFCSKHRRELIKANELLKPHIFPIVRGSTGNLRLIQ